jgi:hypothetical protein
MKELVMLVLSSLAMIYPVAAQQPASLHGTVRDKAGAVIAGAIVTVDDGSGRTQRQQTDEQGQYRFAQLAPGQYTLTISAAGFVTFNSMLELLPRQTAAQDVALKSSLPDAERAVTTETPPAVTSATDDPKLDGAAPQEQKPAETEAARPSLGAEDSPFAAERYKHSDARVEAITKPGYRRFNGALRFGFNDESLNARNAFAETRPPTQRREWAGSLGSPLFGQRGEFFATASRVGQDEFAVINAQVINQAKTAAQPFRQTLLIPRSNTAASVRANYQLRERHSLAASYTRINSSAQNQGIVSNFDLPERTYTANTRANVWRAWLTSASSERLTNEVFFQVRRTFVTTRARNSGPGIIVVGSFNGGGNQNALFSDRTDAGLQLRDALTYTAANHTLRVGVQGDLLRLSLDNRANFGGTFTFGADVRRDAAGKIWPDASGKPVRLTPLESYRRVLLGRAGYLPANFIITQGNPSVEFTQGQLAWFAQDDWRVTRRLTFSYGLRHELQNLLSDKLNPAPRLGVAWMPGGEKSGVVRAGAGVFYDLPGTEIAFNTLRYDGQRQKQFIILRPSFFPDVPDTLPPGITSPPSVRIKEANFRAPYLVLATAGYERQLASKITASATYQWQRGVHLLRTRDINAPVDGVRPQPSRGRILQYESAGLLTYHELSASLSASIRRLSLFGTYTLASARSNTEGSSWVPANPYNLTGEFSRTAADLRHRVVISSSVTLPWGVWVNTSINLSSGAPLDLTTGEDDNGDAFFNDRPGFARVDDPWAVATHFGAFDPSPLFGDRLIPRNFGQGPGQFNINLNFTKTFKFKGWADKPKEGQARRAARYSLTLMAQVSNLLNHTNPACVSGVITSPVFGEANCALEARRVNLALRFGF